MADLSQQPVEQNTVSFHSPLRLQLPFSQYDQTTPQSPEKWEKMTTRALVVGGTSGIGYAMACRVAAEASTSVVTISGRTKPRVAAEASTSVVTISGRTKPQNIPHANINFRPLEATSMRQIKQYTDDFKAQGQKLDLLIMTQGIMTMAGRTETAEGIDRKMALHYYGKQLLIRELLPTMSEDGKVIIVFDGWLGSPDKLIWEDLDLKTHFSLGKAADHCMSMNDAMVQYFAAQQTSNGAGRRHFVHAWPGGVSSGHGESFPGIYGRWAELEPTWSACHRKLVPNI
ncbi:hypothetical protein MRS44_003659 [Fusarium solani]|uniref:uncharacterized protein n=1 Tax=Fusarium solani TaxID=169388 RepID=UPI0032C3ECF1|nr:hypothetical protein MRS44_003659 [Fusarium solani]